MNSANTTAGYVGYHLGEQTARFVRRLAWKKSICRKLFPPNVNFRLDKL